MELNNSAPILDLGIVLHSYNKASELAGDTKRYKMDDEFFTVVLEQMAMIENESSEIRSFTYAEA